MSWLRKVWRVLRELTGDDAYERYLAHWEASHASEGGRPMSRREFSAAEIQRRWSGIKRCC
jgi:uncharacterized short protein YbdD (DUF466 family)